MRGDLEVAEPVRRRGRHIDAGVEEDQIAPPADRRRLGLGVFLCLRIRGVIGHRARQRAAPGLDVSRELPELLLRLFLAGRRPEQLDEHEPDLLAARELIGEFLDRLECGIELPQRVHPLEELDQVPLGLDDDILPGVELRQLEVGLGAPRIDPQDLAAQGDRVVEEALVGVQVHGALVGAHGRGGIVDLEVEVADPIVK